MYNNHKIKMYKLLDKYLIDRLKQKTKKKILVKYSNYNTDKNNIPINNLDDIAVKGSVKFYQKKDKLYGENSKDFESKIIKNPTWFDIILLANDMIHTTKDNHHIYLEGIKKKNNKYYFNMGS